MSFVASMLCQVYYNNNQIINSCNGTDQLQLDELVVWSIVLDGLEISTIILLKFIHFG